jgi:hypothetical protein
MPSISRFRRYAVAISANGTCARKAMDTTIFLAAASVSLLQLATVWRGSMKLQRSKAMHAMQ